MAFDYAAAQQTALDLITEFGQVVPMVRLSGGVLNPATGAISTETETSQNVSVVSLPANTSQISAFDDGMREDLIKGRVRFFIMAAIIADGTAVTFEPKAGDLLTFESKKWEIAGATPLNPAGTAVVFNIAAREGGRA